MRSTEIHGRTIRYWRRGLQGCGRRISPEDFTRERLRCLISLLKERYLHQTALNIMVFDSKAAVSRFSGPEFMESPDFATVSHLHADYFVDETHEYLKLRPMGWDKTTPLNPFESRIDLRSNQPADCKISIRNRCLMSLDWVSTHSVTVLEAPVDVRVQGQLLPNGRLTHLETTDRDLLSGARRDFARWTVHTLKTWRFEPSATKERVTVNVTASVLRSWDINKMSIETDDTGSTIDVEVKLGSNLADMPRRRR
jgi:hypothetical protein